MWAILGNGSDQMFKLDLQRDSLGRTHRQHSQILWANSFTFHTMFYENRSGLIFDFAWVPNLCLGQAGDEEHVSDVAHPGEDEPLQLLLVHLDELPDRTLRHIVRPGGN